ncbi:hypothetical protein NDU88_003565 [Pleurodeles waltl]|uniref:Uncharacterized protein n=1 Tax=Pleurodeles waltl TaxID=8319 RepID=A0AAV7MS75_PLEWA|nr:hypothetical protein NDU88_003565 [Pleurodeles waltl]
MKVTGIIGTRKPLTQGEYFALLPEFGVSESRAAGWRLGGRSAAHRRGRRRSDVGPLLKLSVQHLGRAPTGGGGPLDVDAGPAAGARVADFGGGSRHFGVGHRSRSVVVREPVSGGVPAQDFTADGGALRATSGALEEVVSAWSARAPQMVCSDEAVVKRLGACAQTPRCRRRKVDYRDRR